MKVVKWYNGVCGGAPYNNHHQMKVGAVATPVGKKEEIAAQSVQRSAYL